jgi:hypothetical protein
MVTAIFVAAICVSPAGDPRSTVARMNIADGVEHALSP